jgi:hypothetical protein
VLALHRASHQRGEDAVFRAGFRRGRQPFFVAVDIVHPVAGVVAQDGRLVSVESWAHFVDPPSESPWPNRRFGVAPDRLLVHDLPDGGAVAMTVQRAGTVTTGAVPLAALDAEGVLVRHPRVISAPRGTRTEPTPGWCFVSRPHRYQWSSAVEFRRGGAVSTWSVGRGSIVAHAQHSEAAALCVRRAGQRPWEFDPVIELSFELPDLPDVRLVRVDKPVNELGHLAGLGSLTVLLDEDLGAGDLVEVLLEDVGPVDGRLHI